MACWPLKCVALRSSVSGKSAFIKKERKKKRGRPRCCTHCFLLAHSLQPVEGVQRLLGVLFSSNEDPPEVKGHSAGSLLGRVYWVCSPRDCIPSVLLSLLACKHSRADLPQEHCTMAPLSLNGTFSQPHSSLSSARASPAAA